MTKFILSFFVFLLIIGCTGGKTSGVLDEAYDVHTALRQTQKEVIEQWIVLDSFKSKLEQYADLNATYVAQRKMYAGWKHDLLEVPGYPHIHLEGDEHDHHQHEQKNLPDEQILEIQKEARKAIEEIHSVNLQLIDKISQL